MPTQVEEQEAKEFLKRAEIRTMKKDLRKLREFDALKERDKIAKIKTLEEQRLEQQEALRKKEEERLVAEREKREKILGENAIQERLAEKDLKEYATEQERQQIFIFESQRIAFEKKVEEIDGKKDPALKLEKNNILIEKRGWQEKLNKILEQEKKLESEENFINQKSQESAIASEKKGLEERRWEIEKEVQEIEKKRWQIEKEIENIENKIVENEKSSQSLVVEKNDLNQKILGVDKSLREIYSEVMARVEDTRRGKLEEQRLAKENLSKVRAEEKENIQRQQWRPATKIPSIPVPSKNAGVPVAPVKKSPPMSTRKEPDFSAEEEARKKFMQNVESWAQKGESPKLKEVPIPKK